MALIQPFRSFPAFDELMQRDAEANPDRTADLDYSRGIAWA
jgi:hypothetical protein